MISYLISFLAVIFWLFRVAVAVTATMSIKFIAVPLNLNVEIILLFITLISLTLIFRKNIVGALIYLISYGAYFGTDLYKMLTQNTQITDYSSIFISSLAILIPLLIFIDIGLNKYSRKSRNLEDKKTDWFYKNDSYERKFDERADKNQYKF